MPFLLKKRSLCDVSFAFSLLFFSLFLSLGNFLRLIRTEMFLNNLSFSEALLYLSCLCSYPFTRKLKVSNLFLPILILCIFTSSTYGCLLHGFQLKPSLYSMRLVAMIFSGWVLGKLMFLRFENDLIAFFHFFIKTYAICAFLGWAIFFSFTASEELWLLLGKFHIFFSGEPHIKRFLSPYFDPNYYSAIACIPLLQCYLLWRQTKKNKYLYFLLFFLLTILLSWSRSGILTLFFLCLCILFQFVRATRFFKVHRSLFSYSIFSLILLVLISLFFSDPFAHFLTRSFHLDDSAVTRLISYHAGWELFRERPLFGMGYDYVTFATLFSEKIPYVDIFSSLFSTLLNFGLIPFMIALFLFFLWSFNSFSLSRKIQVKNPFLYNSFRLFYCYLCLILFFTAQFNNLLYYPFWLIPILTIFSYLHLSMRSHCFEGKKLETL
jgi:hypothetical protein